MKKRIIALLMIFAVLGLLFSACERKDTPKDSSESGELKIFQEWETDIPFQLLFDHSTKVGVTVRGSFNTDWEAVRKEVSARTDAERIEARFSEQEMRWVKCTADILLEEGSEYLFSDLSFNCYLNSYPQTAGGGAEYSNDPTYSAEISSEDASAVFAFETSEDLRSCRVFLYGYIPAENDSLVFEIARCVKGDRNFKLPELPSETVLCWKIPEIK